MRDESLLQLTEGHCPSGSPAAVGRNFTLRALKPLCFSEGRGLLMSPLRSDTGRSIDDRHLRKEITNRGPLKMERKKE